MYNSKGYVFAGLCKPQRLNPPLISKQRGRTHSVCSDRQSFYAAPTWTQKQIYISGRIGTL